MSEIEKIKLYQNAGIEPTYTDECIIANNYWRNEELANAYGTFDKFMERNCKFGYQDCTDECEYAYTKTHYPPFTAEKQLSLFQWVCKKFGEIYISYTDFEEVKSWEIVYKISVHRDSFEECLCAFINLFWQSLTSEEKQQIKEILNG